MSLYACGNKPEVGDVIERTYDCLNFPKGSFYRVAAYDPDASDPITLEYDPLSSIEGGYEPRYFKLVCRKSDLKTTEPVAAPAPKPEPVKSIGQICYEAFLEQKEQLKECDETIKIITAMKERYRMEALKSNEILRKIREALR